jgi:REP element-mobilizing transposase RayT
MTPGSLSTIVRSYKSAVTKMINKSRNTPGRSVWQRNFHEHIIRNEAEMNLIREYIQNNPLKWAESRRGAACCAPTVKPRFDWMLHD